MNDARKASFRAHLQSMRDDLDIQDQRGHDSQRTVKLDQQAVGRLSRMDAMQQQQMAKANQARRNQMKTRITAALARLETGEFGFCLSCGDDITEKRLNLDPTLPTCLSCATGQIGLP